MRRLTKLVATVAALTMIFAMPVLATEKTNVAEKNLIDNHSTSVVAAVNDLAKTQVNPEAFKAHEATVMHQLIAADNQEFDNYVLYLQRVVVNSEETLRIKQQNVNSMIDVCKVNPGFAPQVEAAQKELAAAQAQLDADKLAVVIAKQAQAAKNAAIAAK